MIKYMANFWKEEDGLGTLEILLIVAVLVGIAILFGNTIVQWVTDILEGINPEAPDVPSSVG